MNFTIELTRNISFISAFTAGLLTFLTPCIIPLIPTYFSIITGLSADNFKTGNKKTILYTTLGKTLLFIAGFTITFIAFGATATFIGKFISQYQSIITKIGGAIIIVFGIFMLDIVYIPFLSYEKKLHIQQSNSVFFPFLFGITFGFGWTPCIGPVLGSILIIASSYTSVFKGMYLLFMYAMGLGMLFMIFGILFTFMFGIFKKISQYTVWIKRVSALILIAAGILMILDKFRFTV